MLGPGRVEVPAHQTVSVEVRVPLDRLQVRDGGRWVLHPGTYLLAVARHSADRDARDVIWDHQV